MDRTPEDICRLAEVVAAARKRSVNTVSRLATGSGDTVNRLRAGHRITTGRAARALQWLSENWPEGLAWPADIPRPPKAKKEAA